MEQERNARFFITKEQRLRPGRDQTVARSSKICLFVMFKRAGMRTRSPRVADGAVAGEEAES